MAGKDSNSIIKVNLRKLSLLDLQFSQNLLTAIAPMLKHILHLFARAAILHPVARRALTMPIPNISTLRQLSLIQAIKVLPSEELTRQSEETTTGRVKIDDSLAVLPHLASLFQQVEGRVATFKTCNGLQAKVLVVVVRRMIATQHIKLPMHKMQMYRLRVNPQPRLTMTCSACQANYVLKMKRAKSRKGKRYSS